ncbi:MAG: adenosine-specific kinase [Anaerolineae bacterium]
MELHAVAIEKPDDANVILGQSHFIKTVEDIYEALVGAVPRIKFGVAFCEASGPCLVRTTGTDAGLERIAAANAMNVAAGHFFVIVLGEGAYPVNVLNTVKMVPEVCRVFCATANPVQVLVAETEQGRGVVGVVDGSPSKGIESAADVADRKALLRRFGYKQ